MRSFFTRTRSIKPCRISSGNRLRISTDNRYQRADDDIDSGALKPHFGLRLSMAQNPA